MELVSIVLLLLLIILFKNKSSEDKLNFKRIENELKLLKKQILESSIKHTEETKITDSKPSAEPKPFTSLFTVSEVKDPPPAIPKEKIISGKKEEDPYKPQQNNVKELLTELKATSANTGQQFKKPKPTFFERNPDLEKFIGENLVSKIGIAVLVLAIGFFVKYAIDQNWVGAIGRVTIGILCGGILVGIAHKLRNTYKAFSSVLAGGGLAVFYFTITLAFQQFHLFNQIAAFAIMIIITVFAVILALLYDKQELAIIALIGGFVAPFLVSTGNNNYTSLFIYLIILNSGLLVIAYNKGWRLLNLLSFVFTAILFGTWLITLKDEEGYITYKRAFVFATIFYLLFFIINIAHNIKEKKKFIASDFGILLLNTSLYFGTGIFCLVNINSPELKGLFSASLGIFNLAASYFLFRKQKVDTNILYLLIGITLTFISITAPIQLHGNFITLFWASETVLLYWLFTKSKINIIRYSAYIIWVLMLGSMLIDWFQIYFGFQQFQINIILNKGFITGLFAACATYLLFLLHSAKSTDTNNSIKTPGKMLIRIFAICILFVSGLLEINYQFEYYYPDLDINILFLILYTITFIFIALLIAQKVKSLNRSLTNDSMLTASAILLYLLTLPQVFLVQSEIITKLKKGNFFIAHWITALLIGFLFYRLIKLLRNSKTISERNLNIITWLVCTGITIFLSSEILLLCNQAFYNSNTTLGDISTTYVKTGLPILWGICSFAFMWLGMRNKYKALRIISLSLFTLTLLKLFIFDIRNISAGGKIAAFFCLGILLLVVSFMYQRLKTIIIDDEKKVD